MSFWGFNPDDDPTRNRFIPPDPIEDDWILRTAKLQVAPTADNDFCLIDNAGFVVTLYELTEILTAIKPFYDQVHDRDIVRVNERHLNSQRDPHRRIAVAPSGPPQPGYVYIVEGGPFYKIGATKKVDRRIKELSTIPPFDLELVCTIATDDMYALEFELHRRFQDKHKRGEWFTLDTADIEYLQSLASEQGQP